MYLRRVYFSAGILSIARGHSMPSAEPAASLVTFQRVLRPHSWIPLSETVMREKKGGRTETEEVRARRGWVKAHYASQQAAHTRLQTASSPSSADAELCGEFHTYVRSMINNIFYCLNLAKPCVCFKSLFPFFEPNIVTFLPFWPSWA